MFSGWTQTISASLPGINSLNNLNSLNSLTEGVNQLASKIKETVATATAELDNEQKKFVESKQPHEREKQNSEAVPPWVGFHNEESLKEDILKLSLDKRNFLMDPPPDSQFSFDLSISYPIARATMEFDPHLENMRYLLVPKQIKEYNFWRNYFYRVSLIRQSSQLADAENFKSEFEKDFEQTSPKEKNEEINEDLDFLEEGAPNEYNPTEEDESWLDGVKEEDTSKADPSGEFDWEKEMANELSDYPKTSDSDQWETDLKDI